MLLSAVMWGVAESSTSSGACRTLRSWSVRERVREFARRDPAGRLTSLSLYLCDLHPERQRWQRALTPMWREVLTVWDTGETMASDWWSGSWSDNYGCASSSTRDSNQIRLEFKVQDCSGAESTVRNSAYYCR
jgi:hypothetical protein